MKTLLLFTIVLAAIVLPLLTARVADPRRGIRRLVFLLLLVNTLYLFYVTQVHPVLFVPKRP